MLEYHAFLECGYDMVCEREKKVIAYYWDNEIARPYDHGVPRQSPRGACGKKLLCVGCGGSVHPSAGVDCVWCGAGRLLGGEVHRRGLRSPLPIIVVVVALHCVLWRTLVVVLLRLDARTIVGA